MKRGRRRGAKLAECACGKRFVVYPVNDSKSKTCGGCGKIYSRVELDRLYTGYTVRGAQLVTKGE
jgi:hypothetical protein